MVGSSSRGSSVDSVSHQVLPRCGCDRPMKMWVSNTVQNRNRKFWKCRNAGTGNSCELFLWDDENGDSMKDNTVIHPCCKKCEVLQIQLESVTKKVVKLKIKLEAQKRKTLQLQIAIFMCCLIVGLLYNFM
ncbi:uncharacterized protein LOC131630030 [Vicia villosa]|uniref:uncharacterized protein LOC131603201 n=2 Tax=Vicia villosa TaxID=3911 RepID=UPI00273CB4A8|nr:uncharacterized protein LOC131603201 [Vicia villosa]XP_058756807.1 uncharacterized protein LOC131630030 [Vicia villosa]